MFPFFGLLAGVDKTLKLLNETVNDFVIPTDTATAQIRLTNTGNFDRQNGGAGWTSCGVDEWITDEFAALPGFDASKYEGGFFSVTGSTSYLSGTLDTYLALSSTRFWTLQRTYTGFGLDSVTGTLKVREIANPSNEVTCTVTLTLSAEF